jgi:hypothetical protein
MYVLNVCKVNTIVKSDGDCKYYLFLGVYKVNVIIKADADSNEQVYTAEYSAYGTQNRLRKNSRSYLFQLYIMYYSVATCNKYTVSV